MWCDMRDGLKIAIIGHLKYPIAQPFAGGLEMHTHLLARHLIARGHDVTLFAAEGSDPALAPVCVCEPTGIPSDTVSQASIADTEHRAYAEIIGSIATGGFDVVHNNSLHYLPLIEAHRIAAPMVTMFHTPPFPELVHGVVERGRRDIQFFGVSEKVRAMWRKVIAVDGVIMNGIELDLFTAHLEAPRVPVALWYGRLVPEKGAHLAIAAARLAKMPLRLVGPRNDAVYWRDVIAPELGPDITYLGHLDHADLAAEIAQASVAVITPRFEEPYGLVVAEALACGTPVAGFARGALPELLDDATGRLVPPDDVEALAKALPQAVVLSRAACRRRAELLCDARVMMDGYEALYRQLLAPYAIAAE
nr:glycosyltransferase [Plastoroseomonas arctica]